MYGKLSEEDIRERCIGEELRRHQRDSEMRIIGPSWDASETSLHRFRTTKVQSFNYSEDQDFACYSSSESIVSVWEIEPATKNADG